MQHSVESHRPYLYKRIFFWNFAFSLCLVAIIAGIGFFSLYHYFVDYIGNTRNEILAQVSERSKVVRSSAYALANKIYNEAGAILLYPDPDAEIPASECIEAIIEDANSYYELMDIHLSVAIIMRNRYEFLSRNSKEIRLDEIKNTYWYMDNFANSKTDLWLMSINDPTEPGTKLLSYCKVIRGDDGRYEGVILVNSSEQNLRQIYADIATKQNRICILNEDGYVISHSNPALIGMQLYYMPAFLRSYTPGTYHISKKNGTAVLYTQYSDSSSSWTFVQETDLAPALSMFSPVFQGTGIFLIIMVLMGIFISFRVSKEITNPLKFFSERLRQASAADFQPLYLPASSYEEIYQVSLVYNVMVEHIKELIGQIKEDALAKQKARIDFLLMQINPHFLHNTLFSIKCMIDCGQMEKASSMTSHFLRMLKEPLQSHSEYIELSAELDSLKNYVELMRYRYGENIHLHCYTEATAERFPIAQFLLQPIVENCIFHGFSASSGVCEIEVFAYQTRNDLFLEIRDNGCGMSSEALSIVWEKRVACGSSFHNIGLSNIKERIALLYGPESFISISSLPGEGTSVVMRLQEKEVML